MEARLRQSHKLDAVGQLTGGIAHDFNNLLTTIIGSLQLVSDPMSSETIRHSLLEAALEGAQRGREHVTRLLAFARRQQLEPEVIDVGALARDIEPLIKQAVGEAIALEIRATDALWSTLIDPGQLETALLNLAVNAADAMPAGGTLSIGFANVALQAPLTSDRTAVPAGDYVVVTVSDTGTGIAEESIGKIFEPFFTTKPAGKGTGLGLSMVFGFVAQSSGYIDVSSVLGSGATFRIFLPRFDGIAVVERDEAQPATGGTPLGSETVLLVEDQHAVRRTVRALLESIGYSVREAGDAESALLQLREHDDVDLLLTDLVMPGGMSGVDLIRAARAQYPALKVLGTSGFADPLMLGADAPELANRVLKKPYERETLAQMVRAALDDPP